MNKLTLIIEFLINKKNNNRCLTFDYISMVELSLHDYVND